MSEQNTYSGSSKLTVGVAIIGLVVGNLCCRLDAAADEGCNRLGTIQWVALEVLRLALLLVERHSILTHVFENTWVLHQLVRIGACFEPALRTLVG